MAPGHLAAVTKRLKTLQSVHLLVEPGSRTLERSFKPCSRELEEWIPSAWFEIFVNMVGERVRKTAARSVVLNKAVPGWYDFWLKWETGGNEALNFSQPERQRSQRSFCQKGSCWRMREGCLVE